ncbi:MAG: DUF2493 domain-containing protein [Oscillospiraceae bacterium]|nr:DUF2493 domain-containing protein [Oscillospiraceae bacterium]
MKVAVIGSRSMSEDLFDFMLENIPIGCSEIISGGAEGADRLAERCAEKLSLPLLVFEPDYKKYGKSAPLQRNCRIVEAADYVLVFWDGKSKGTANTIITCLNTGKPIKIISV